MTPRKKKYVTLEAFLRKLRKTPHATWSVGWQGYVRCASGLCPLEKVFALGPDGFVDAPMTDRDRRLVVGAADGDAQPRFRKLRPRLLRACGLTEMI